MPKDSNFAAYDSPEVISLFAGYSMLFPSEKYLFAKYVPAGASILDLGVGGGRTTPVLAAKAKRYVGVDYVPGMVDACASKFPNYEFVCADAAALDVFADASFDIVVFSFNGLDVLPVLKKRAECLEEVRRVLSPNGVFLFSSHNARMLAHTPSLKIEPLLRAFIKTWPYSRELIRSGAFLRGAGYYRDVSHTGTEFYSSTPKLIAHELGIAGFELIETTHDHKPRRVPTFLIPWHYYVARRL
jgi:ubiquinone/menaquinone biosynthesis C-methylase UbiE